MRQLIQYKTVYVRGQSFEMNKSKDYKYAVLEDDLKVYAYEHEPIWDEEEQTWYPQQIGKRNSNRIFLGYMDPNYYNGHKRDSLFIIK